MRTSVVFDIHNIPGFHASVRGESNIPALKWIQRNDQPAFKVVRYDKDYLSIDLIETIGLLRSVVLRESKVVAFAPPKSVPLERLLPSLGDGASLRPADHIVAEEFVEGTMINVFWDTAKGLGGGWEIATRSCVGADTVFYASEESRQTFGAMFAEAAKYVNLDLMSLDRSLCYSFVLQHPKNRIVVPFAEPALYLVAVYEVSHVDDDQIFVYPQNMEKVKALASWENTCIQFPERYDSWDTYEDLRRQFASPTTSFTLPGVVLQNPATGRRSKIRNPNYEHVRLLRGNQPKLQYHYMMLRKNGRVSEYLEFYPEHKQEFQLYRNWWHRFTRALFANYISCYVNKQKPLIEYPENFRTHMFSLHRLYLDQLMPKGLFVSPKTVQTYANSLHPRLQVYSANYGIAP